MTKPQGGNAGAPRCWPWATVTMAAIAVLLYAWPAATPVLWYDRDRVIAGEWWRVVTCNWVHFSASHLLWNVAVLLAAGIWCERIEPVRTRVLYLLAPAVIGLVLLAGDPALVRYAGLSGVATAVLVFLAATQWRAGRDRWFWVVVLVAVVLKIALESRNTGPLFARFGNTGIQPVPLAHLGGLMVAMFLHGARRRPAKAANAAE